MTNQKKKTLIAVIVLVVVVAAALCLWLVFKPGVTAGSKTLSVQVIHDSGETADFTIHTDEEYLRGALEQDGLVKGEESEYGLYIMTVDGETADESKEQWWCVTKGGEWVMTGVDDTPIADGEQYEITLKTGW